uniref:Uncharacterized protein n=1 Tax=viral metagenome TaxID=1070528 RepID=A0A6H1ZX62_9ZZZZ
MKKGKNCLLRRVTGNEIMPFVGGLLEKSGFTKAEQREIEEDPDAFTHLIEAAESRMRVVAILAAYDGLVLKASMGDVPAAKLLFELLHPTYLDRKRGVTDDADVDVPDYSQFIRVLAAAHGEGFHQARRKSLEAGKKTGLFGEETLPGGKFEGQDPEIIDAEFEVKDGGTEGTESPAAPDWKEMFG